jgi:hypothetical protein
MSGELKIALIAALSALAGTAIGGVISYQANVALLDREFEREDRLRLSQASAAAKTELGRFVSASELLRALDQSRAYPPADERLSEELVSAERQGLLAQMERRRIETYERARGCIMFLRRELAQRNPGDTVSRFALLRVRAWRDCVRAGVDTLVPLAEREIE